jgi:hypothetical protein
MEAQHIVASGDYVFRQGLSHAAVKRATHSFSNDHRSTEESCLEQGDLVTLAVGSQLLVVPSILPYSACHPAGGHTVPIDHSGSDSPAESTGNTGYRKTGTFFTLLGPSVTRIGDESMTAV